MSDLTELFSRDPLSFTKEGEEVKKIVTRLREARGQFDLGSQKAGNLKAPKSAKGKAVASLAGSGLSLNLQALLNKGKAE